MTLTNIDPVITVASPAATRAADGAYSERMIAFTGFPPEGAIEDAKA